MANHSSILAWRILWTEVSGRQRLDTTEQLTPTYLQRSETRAHLFNGGAPDTIFTQYPRGIGSMDTMFYVSPWIPKSLNAQVLYIQ